MPKEMALDLEEMSRLLQTCGVKDRKYWCYVYDMLSEPGSQNAPLRASVERQPSRVSRSQSISHDIKPKPKHTKRRLSKSRADLNKKNSFSTHGYYRAGQSMDYRSYNESDHNFRKKTVSTSELDKIPQRKPSFLDNLRPQKSSKGPQMSSRHVQMRSKVASTTDLDKLQRRRSVEVITAHQSTQDMAARSRSNSEVHFCKKTVSTTELDKIASSRRVTGFKLDDIVSKHGHPRGASRPLRSHPMARSLPLPEDTAIFSPHNPPIYSTHGPIYSKPNKKVPTSKSAEFDFYYTPTVLTDQKEKEPEPEPDFNFYFTLESPRTSQQSSSGPVGWAGNTHHQVDTIRPCQSEPQAGTSGESNGTTSSNSDNEHDNTDRNDNTWKHPYSYTPASLFGKMPSMFGTRTCAGYLSEVSPATNEAYSYFDDETCSNYMSELSWQFSRRRQANKNKQGSASGATRRRPRVTEDSLLRERSEDEIATRYTTQETLRIGDSTPDYYGVHVEVNINVMKHKKWMNECQNQTQPLNLFQNLSITDYDCQGFKAEYFQFSCHPRFKYWELLEYG